MTSGDVKYIFVFYGKRSVFRLGIYQSSAGADRTCRVLDRSTINYNVYSWHLRGCFSDTFVWPYW